MANIKVTKIDNAIEAALDDVFVPTSEMRKAKARFVNSIKGKLFIEPENLTQAELIKYSKTKKIVEWIKEDGFLAWLNDKNEQSDRMEYLTTLAFDRIEAILTGDSSDKDALNAAKLLIEAQTKAKQSDQRDKFLDRAISSMDAAQLESFIQKQGAQVIDVEALPEHVEEESADES